VSKQSIDFFWEACGGSGSLCLRITHPERREPQEYVLPHPFALVGREARADISLQHPDVSRRHAFLQVLGGRVFCLDLRSRTGVLRAGKAALFGWLDPFHPVQIGPFVVRLREEKEGSPGATGELRRSISDFLRQYELPKVTLEVVHPAEDASTWQMRPLIALVGKSSDCRVGLVSRTVSNYHCSLVRTPLGVWVVDLFGRGGTRVNDVASRYALLEDGDLLQVGKFVVRIRYDTAPLTRPRTTAPAGTAPAAEADVVRLNQERSSREPGPVAPETPLPGFRGLPAVLGEKPSPVHLPALGAAARSIEPVQPAGSLAERQQAVQALLAPVVEQIGQMQQQMTEQFQQTVQMMLQMFSTLHKEQVSTIRKELDRVQELTEQINALHGELANNGAQRTPSTSGAQIKPSSKKTPAKSDKDEATELLPTLDAALRERPTLPETEHELSAEPSAQPAAEAGKEAVEVSRDEMHARLTQRIAALQREQQSRWQRIIQTLVGK
jgi:pSer/pThr/pTyr-binding forkhead associated (FHA) protein